MDWEEAPGSGTITSEPPTKTLRYIASGSEDDHYIWSFALGATPAIIPTPRGTLYRQDLRIDPGGWGIRNVTVPYAASKRNSGDLSFTFDTTGATVKIKCAKEHIASYGPSGQSAALNVHKGAIGVKQDHDVEGADIVIPGLKFSVSYKHPLGVVTMPYVKALARVTGSTNQLPFLTYAAGELLFLGATGSDGIDADAIVNYHFVADENAVGLKFGNIMNVNKPGHHVAWVEFSPKTEGGRKATQPSVVHIERVYDPRDFELTFGWS
jgi:hypothetical protein